MGKSKNLDLPWRDPISGNDFIVTELTCEDSGVVLRGRFAIPEFAKLSEENRKFLETFLRCRGVITLMERELGISYPTVKNRLESLLLDLDLSPIKEDKGKKDKDAERKVKILEQLERGEITAEQAKAQIKERVAQ